MASNDYLSKLFQDLYSLEEEAKKLYDDFLESLSSEEEIKVISEIRDDEIRHMTIAKKLQQIVKDEN